jgi:hypothetical protein
VWNQRWVGGNAATGGGATSVACGQGATSRWVIIVRGGGCRSSGHNKAEKGSRQPTGRGTQQATDGTRHRAAADRSHVRRIARPLRPVQRKKTRQGRAWARMLSAQYTRKHVRRFGSGESVRLGATSAQSSERSSPRAKYTGQA